MLDVNDHFGTTIVLIEHDIGVVMDLSDRVVVLDHGIKIADGSPDDVMNNQSVIDAYLGRSHTEDGPMHLLYKILHRPFRADGWRARSAGADPVGRAWSPAYSMR